MLTRRPTKAMLRRWQRLHARFRPLLRPNRAPGVALHAYFVQSYAPLPLKNADFTAAVRDNLLLNEHSHQKLPPHTAPDIVTYQLADGPVWMGIDRVTGFFHVECRRVRKAAAVWDDLFCFRGLDAADLENPFLVAQYVQLAARRQRRARKQP